MLVGGGCRAEGNQGEKKWDNCNSIINKIYLKKQERNQDGGVGRHNLAQPELTENRTARGTSKEIENKHSSRLVGGAETGTGWRGRPWLWWD